MATANLILPQPGEDNYELEVNRVREKIKSTFLELIDCLKERESKLLRDLDTIVDCYRSYKSELTKLNEKKIAIEKLKYFHQNEILTSPIKCVHEDLITRLDTEIESIEFPEQPRMVSFTCENNKLLDEVKKFGKLVRSGIDYTNKKQPLMSVCTIGSGNEQLNYLWGVTVDNKTGNIYIADTWNNCIKVFDSTAKYLFKFRDSTGEGAMKHPNCLSIYGNRVLISQPHCILNYNLDGKFISKVGKQGNGELQFYHPRGLTIDDSNEDIYICDRNNNRVQILTKDLCYKTEFGTNTLKHPLNVKHSKEYIYVLDESNPCIHLFNRNLILQKSVISRGNGNQVLNPFSFFIDNSDFILIADFSSNAISIFNPEFKLVHKIPVSSNPVAVTVDNQNRVIVVCHNDKNCLQIF
ncbi:Tripartite motif-containing protein 2 [Oopsacas minuta]|uniref:Tripartite motif-containing protein 2 n=1 Tax=Oopsacas minuta TaxID=111878 RepID=A0AAV7JPR3_9METZ|nr:Tripartite motif-containing protein 2 [Oopsacas minuta]